MSDRARGFKPTLLNPNCKGEGVAKPLKGVIGGHNNHLTLSSRGDIKTEEDGRRIVGDVGVTAHGQEDIKGRGSLLEGKGLEVWTPDRDVINCVTLPGLQLHTRAHVLCNTAFGFEFNGQQNQRTCHEIYAAVTDHY